MLKKYLVVYIICGLMLSPLSALAITKQVKDSRSTFTIEDRHTYPVVFLPGMAGSVLSLGGGNDVWPGSLSGGDSSFDDLSLKIDGRTAEHGRRLLAVDVMKYGVGDASGFQGGWFAFPVYQGFYDYMMNEGYSLSENLKTGKQFFDFPYDFRTDNHDWTKLLDKKIDEVRDKTKSDKVILFAHSMGGYQARLYIADPSRAKKVAAVVFMGTPHHGSPMAFWSYTNGYNFGNKKISDTKMWEVAANWPGGYQLLPDYKFLQNADGSFWSIDRTYGDGYITQQEYDHYLKAKKDGRPYNITYGLPNKQFVKDSLALHAGFGLKLPQYPELSYYMIEGTKQDTVQYFEADLENVGLPKPLLKLTKIITPRGDGTVASGGSRVEGATKFSVPSEHGAIASNAGTHKLLTMIVRGVNHEIEREGIAQDISKFATTHLQTLALTDKKTQSVITADDKDKNLIQALIQILFVGTPDEKKIALRDELRAKSKQLFKTTHANIIIRDSKNGDDSYYIIIENYGVVSTGPGVVNSALLTVTIDSKETFDDIVNNVIDPVTVLQQGKITLSGSGPIQTFTFKLFEWISKYVSKFLKG
ncbi:MAG: alpha/beta fold hydrolase [Candidatus Vogelbacteria bacterium]|nr:alpha/beta fold hydrolase [Candidatus Vogelbacteria bacterium]